MRIVIAPDKFKGTLSAAEAAAALREGALAALPDADVTTVAVADGGEGTLDALVAAGFERHPVEVAGPTGEPVQASWVSREQTAAVELADACGLARLPGGRLAPWDASSYGLGEAVLAAVASGAHRLIVGLGGSASTDGGAGLAQALGARLYDVSGAEIMPGLRELGRLASADFGAMRQLPVDLEVVLACDVTTPLLGKQGAAAVFGPQKGLHDGDVKTADEILTRWADVVAEGVGRDDRDRSGSGAAGGVGFGAMAFLNGKMAAGVDYLLDTIGFDDRLAGADLVITGEGALDRQTLAGKTVAGVAHRCVAQRVPVAVACGRNELAESATRDLGIREVCALEDVAPSPRAARDDAGHWLREAAARLCAGLR